jgi:hypothetical protein
MASNKGLNKKVVIVIIAVAIMAAIFILFPRETTSLKHDEGDTLQTQIQNSVCLGSSDTHINATSVTYHGIPSISSRVYNDKCSSQNADNADIYWSNVFEDGLVGGLVGGLLVLAPLLIMMNKPLKTNNSR